MRWWSIRIAVASLVMILVLSGCMTQQATTTVTSDGSGTNVVLVGFTKEFLDQMGEEGSMDDLEQQSSDLPAEWNAQVEPWEDDTYKGVKVTTQFRDPAMLEAQLNAILGPESDSSQSGGGLLETFTVQQDGSMLRISTRLRQNQNPDEEGEIPPGTFGNMKITWSVTMPSITSYTEEGIATQDGNTVTWTFPLIAERDYDIEVQGTLDGEVATDPVPEPTAAPTDPTPAVPSDELPGERCFDEVSSCISGRIRQYWEENGGLPVFGFPIAPQQEEMIEGQALQVQWFERNRLELHPENERPYDVLLGRLGVDVLEQQGRNWQDFPREEPQDGCVYFEQTGHNVCGDILSAWRANGLEMDGVAGLSQAENMALFGQPVSGLITEELSDGNEYQVQYFERARFELHPENDPPYNVLFGLLGNEIQN